MVAVEPAAALRAEGQRLHPEAGLRWVEDSLPGLAAMHRLGLACNMILVSGVWQHLASAERPRAMRKMLGLLRPGGVLALTAALNRETQVPFSIRFAAILIPIWN